MRLLYKFVLQELVKVLLEGSLLVFDRLNLKRFCCLCSQLLCRRTGFHISILWSCSFHLPIS